MNFSRVRSFPATSTRLIRTRGPLATETWSTTSPGASPGSLRTEDLGVRVSLRGEGLGHAVAQGQRSPLEKRLAQQAGRQSLERRGRIRQRVPLEHHARDHEAGPLDDLEAHVGDAAVGAQRDLRLPDLHLGEALVPIEPHQVIPAGADVGSHVRDRALLREELTQLRPREEGVPREGDLPEQHQGTLADGEHRDGVGALARDRVPDLDEGVPRAVAGALHLEGGVGGRCAPARRVLQPLQLGGGRREQAPRAEGGVPFDAHRRRRAARQVRRRARPRRPAPTPRTAACERVTIPTPFT